VAKGEGNRQRGRDRRGVKGDNYHLHLTLWKLATLVQCSELVEICSI